MKKILNVTLVSILLTTTLTAHSGNTDSSGCHTNHKTGEYHCHNSKHDDEGGSVDILVLIGAVVATAGIIWWVNEKAKKNINNQYSYQPKETLNYKLAMQEENLNLVMSYNF